MDNQLKPIEKISVRRLVEFILRSGDLDTGTISGRRDTEAMLAGSRVHKKIQKNQKSTYTAEVPLSIEQEYEELILKIEGRADGIVDEEREDSRYVMIDEIKGMYLDITALGEPFPLHLAQAKCYAYIYALEEGLEEIDVQITYVSLESDEVNRLKETCQFDELEKWFSDLCHHYYQWARWKLLHQKARNESMKHLEFPFPYRDGQQKLTHTVYHTIREGKDLFLMAPTGVGKTMSCIYPSVRAVGQGLGDMIFYLTAKNETLRAGEEAFRILRNKGLEYKTVRITSKEKICPMSEVRCNPKDCPYAKGHFDRINDAVFELLTDDGIELYDRETLQKHAEKWKVCPFELTLDTASWVDAVLCDYNYVFDPNAKLNRFFGEGRKGEYLFLVDEAHNLVDRGRQMYSSSLTKEHVLAAKRIVGKEEKRLVKALERLNKLMLSLKHDLEDSSLGEAGDITDTEAADSSAKKSLRLFVERAEGRLRTMKASDLEQIEFAALHVYEELQKFYQNTNRTEVKEALLDFYFEVGDFCATMQEIDEHYVTYMSEELRAKEAKEEKPKTEFSVKLFCVNPAKRLTEAVERGRSAVFFSATLLPIQYFKEHLTVREDVYAIYADSPFPKQHRSILIGTDVSTRYRDRGADMYRRIADYIRKTAEAKTGNYLIFFPSYRMMMDVFRIYRNEFDSNNINWVVQSPYMSDMDREIFLEDFYEEPEKSLVGFAVMGGVFSEGLDLTGTRLIGAVIVGTALPQVSLETDVLKAFYDREKDGFAYAYRYPGMNKVEQAAGRVIRTMTDRGVILLLDDRFTEYGYKRLFPREWEGVTQTVHLGNVEEALGSFWEQI